MALEDAFLLAVLLSEYYEYPDGHQEAFYQFCKARMAHCATIATESYQQSKIGQWTHPLLIMLREMSIRYIPRSFLQKKLRRINMWRVDPWMTKFRTNVTR